MPKAQTTRYRSTFQAHFNEYVRNNNPWELLNGGFERNEQFVRFFESFCEKLGRKKSSPYASRDNGSAAREVWKMFIEEVRELEETRNGLFRGKLEEAKSKKNSQQKFSSDD